MKYNWLWNKAMMYRDVGLRSYNMRNTAMTRFSYFNSAVVGVMMVMTALLMLLTIIAAVMLYVRIACHNG